MPTTTIVANPDGSLTLTVEIAAVELPASAVVLNQLSNLGTQLATSLDAIHNASNGLTDASATAAKAITDGTAAVVAAQAAAQAAQTAAEQAAAAPAPAPPILAAPLGT